MATTAVYVITNKRTLIVYCTICFAFSIVIKFEDEKERKRVEKKNKWKSSFSSKIR